MWIFTETGFVSAVKKHDTPEVITVRARDRESLEAVVTHTGGEIITTPHGDYPYRAFVSPERFAAWAENAASEIDYDNFKSKVAASRGYSFAHSLHDVWAAMLAVEDASARDRSTDG